RGRRAGAAGDRRRARGALRRRPARLVLAGAAEHVAHRRADSAAEDEARDERGAGDEQEVRAEPRADVRGLTQLAAQLLDGLGELLPFLADRGPHLLLAARLSDGHLAAPPDSA